MELKHGNLGTIFVTRMQMNRETDQICLKGEGLAYKY